MIEELELPAVKRLPEEYLQWLMGAVHDAHLRACRADIRGRKSDRLEDVYSRTIESEGWFIETTFPVQQEAGL